MCCPSHTGEGCTGYTCSECGISLCGRCSTKNILWSICTRRNCFHCAKQTCWNRYAQRWYCEGCAADSESLKIQEERREWLWKFYLKVLATERLRRFILERALRKAGLELRADSRLCTRFIQQGVGDLRMIVERMCQLKWLFDYQNMGVLIQEIKELDLEDPDYDDYLARPLQIAEARILAKTPFPRIWPWQAEHAARIIQKACHNWLHKPKCKDGTLGIGVRFLLKYKISSE